VDGGTVPGDVIVVGYGVKGASAMKASIEQGRRADGIVVVDRDGVNVAADSVGIVAADSVGIVGADSVGIVGDATRESVLEHADRERADHRRERRSRRRRRPGHTDLAPLAPTATIVASVREGQNLGVVRQSGPSPSRRRNRPAG